MTKNVTPLNTQKGTLQACRVPSVHDVIHLSIEFGDKKRHTLKHTKRHPTSL
nr:MAG TPA: hypothetical protein [Caudoviricetes sp.]